jgi:2-oxoacid:acceptor oxidoreductase gamma subunit (pyruvate/2-ketoisovalerate family)
VVESLLKTRAYEIRWHGRGGQGAITAAKIAAQAAYLDGYRGVTVAPAFGAERRGAPVSASTRIAPEPVLVMCQIEKPDVVVVLDYTLLEYEEVLSGLGEGGWLVLNSALPPHELHIKDNFNFATADATAVCQELGLVVAGLTVVDTAILGAFVRATMAVSLESIEKVIEQRFSGTALEANLTAVRRTYEITKVWQKGEERFGHQKLSAYFQ